MASRLPPSLRPAFLSSSPIRRSAPVVDEYWDMLATTTEQWSCTFYPWSHRQVWLHCLQLHTNWCHCTLVSTTSGEKKMLEKSLSHVGWKPSGRRRDTWFALEWAGVCHSVHRHLRRCTQMCAPYHHRPPALRPLLRRPGQFPLKGLSLSNRVETSTSSSSMCPSSSTSTSANGTIVWLIVGVQQRRSRDRVHFGKNSNFRGSIAEVPITWKEAYKWALPTSEVKNANFLYGDHGRSTSTKSALHEEGLPGNCFCATVTGHGAGF